MLAAALLIVLLLVIAIAVFVQRKYCMDVPLISEKELGAYTEGSSFDISQLTFNGEKAAVDQNRATVYISQSADKLSHSALLEGTLRHADPNCSLYFVRDGALENIPAAVRSSTPLTLILSDGISYQRVSVIITTLPVVNMEGEITHKNDDNRDVLTGNITLWAGFDPLLEQYSTKSSQLQWHVRGSSSSGQAKNPWKLSLKDENGENRDLDFLGLGADDDWILNSLTIDDTKIKEKLVMDLWNVNAEATDYNFKMSTGEYVEVVINGEYLGLFLLQRRLDAKYLGLSEEDVLLKSNTYGAPSAQELYEFVTPATNTDEIYSIMQRVYEGTDCSAYNLYNMIDTNLFLQLASAVDNFGSKNMYHVLKHTENGYEHFLLPWDTDLSFGLGWNDGYYYDYKAAMNVFNFRIETEGLKKAKPEYDQYASERWSELRQSLLSEANLLSYIDIFYGQLSESGAWIRDKSIWADRYGGEDTIDALKQFICERIAVMDEYYSE